jgi:hypothetical protein
MWWWLALSATAAAGIAFVQSLAAARLGAVVLVRAAIVLAPANRDTDAVFGPIVEQPQLARGLVGHLSMPVSLACFLSLAAAPIVGNSAALTLAHGTGGSASWAQIYPGPGPWLAGAALFAVLAAHAAARIALDVHLRAWGLARTGGWVWWVAALPALAGFAWAWTSVTGADPLAAATALAAGALGTAWAANRAVRAAYGHMGFAPPQPPAAAAGGRALARAGMWLLVLAGAALTAIVRGLDIGAYGSGPVLVVLTPAAVLAGTVLKDLVGDLGDALSRRHGLPFRRDE